MGIEKKLKFAVIGTGFWANYQIAAWKELSGIELVALYNRTRSRAIDTGNRFGVNNIYDDAEELLEKEKPDFIDIITDVDTHSHFTQLAAARGIDVICQKPMASSLEQAEEMVFLCRDAGVNFYVHENFRWQAPIRALKKILDSGKIGKPFKAKLSFCSAFPVFANQPFLAEVDNFIIADVGSHVLDIARFLFGEARSLYCLTKKVNKSIKGEDVANILLDMFSGVHCFVELSYASLLEKESFPQTLALIECENGSVHLSNDFQLSVTTKGNTVTEKISPVMYPWVDPSYAVVHSSIVDCNNDILQGLNGGKSETTGEDNLKTVRLVWSAYASASSGNSITF